MVTRTVRTRFLALASSAAAASCARGGVIGVRCFQVTHHTPHESPTPPRAPKAPGQGTRTSSFIWWRVFWPSFLDQQCCAIPDHDTCTKHMLQKHSPFFNFSFCPRKLRKVLLRMRLNTRDEAQYQVRRAQCYSTSSSVLPYLLLSFSSNSFWLCLTLPPRATTWPTPLPARALPFDSGPFCMT